jgi:hypothetical protein
MGRIRLAVVLSLMLALIAVSAQQPGKVYRVELLSPRPTPFFMNPLVVRMKERGWVEGHDFVLESRYTGGNPEQADEAARELLPRTPRLAVLWDYVPPLTETGEGEAPLNELKRGARQLGVTVVMGSSS